jgi:hypothetical protein
MRRPGDWTGRGAAVSSTANGHAPACTAGGKVAPPRWSAGVPPVRGSTPWPYGGASWRRHHEFQPVSLLGHARRRFASAIPPQRCRATASGVVSASRLVRPLVANELQVQTPIYTSLGNSPQFGDKLTHGFGVGSDLHLSQLRKERGDLESVEKYRRTGRQSASNGTTRRSHPGED